VKADTSIDFIVKVVNITLFCLPVDSPMVEGNQEEAGDPYSADLIGVNPPLLKGPLAQLKKPRSHSLSALPPNMEEGEASKTGPAVSGLVTASPSTNTQALAELAQVCCLAIR